MALLALILAIVALGVTLGTVLLVLVLLTGDKFRYASKVEVRKLMASLANLWRYMEAIDDQTGGGGHRVLLPEVRPKAPRPRD